MTTITEFLLARIAEDEAVAKAASGDGASWIAPDVHGPIVAVDDGTRFGGEPVIYDEGRPSAEQAQHIARHDPARGLRECKAKRAIVEMAIAIGDDGEYAAGYMAPRTRHAGSIGGKQVFEAADIYPGHPNYLQAVAFSGVLRALVQPYADHPDFDAGWVG